MTTREKFLAATCPAPSICGHEGGGPPPTEKPLPMQLLIKNHRSLFALALSAGALLGACDLDKPIGEVGPYEPCAAQKCGDACTVCDPDDAECVETQVIKACNAEGECVASTPELCEQPPAYAPCGGKAVCDPCTICDPSDPDCFETAVLKVCDADLQCVIATEGVCEEPAPWTPCVDRPCGEPCSVCDPNDPDCFETQEIKACDGAGKCVSETPDLCEAPAYDPCAGKAACDSCMLCDPNDPDCVEDAALKVCDESLKCVYATPGLCEVAYDPCEGKVCGDVCTICDPNDPDCVEDLIFKSCDDKGACVPQTPDQCE